MPLMIEFVTPGKNIPILVRFNHAFRHRDTRSIVNLGRMDQHLQHLEECAERHEALRLSLPAASKMDPLDRLCVFNPDFMLEIAMVRNAGEVLLLMGTGTIQCLSYPRP